MEQPWALGSGAGMGRFQQWLQLERPYPCMMVHGGGFDHYGRAGLFCMRNWNATDHRWYLQGSRMQYKPTEAIPVRE